MPSDLSQSDDMQLILQFAERPFHHFSPELLQELQKAES